MTHELGHVVGLGDVRSYSGVKPIMYYSTPINAATWVLTSDDINGYNRIAW